MRFIFYFFLIISGAVSAQAKSNISVISAEELNVVYRGVDNPIKIAVPGVDQNKINVSAPGLRKTEGEGNYIITPGAGREVMIYLVYTMEDGTKKSERKPFKILDLPPVMGIINGHNCSKCIVQLTKEELLKAIIQVKIEDFLFDLGDSNIVKSFTVVLPDKKQIIVEGNVFNHNAQQEIQKLKTNQILNITDIIYYEQHPSIDYPAAKPIKIIIVD
jgi:hypothetical protein